MEIMANWGKQSIMCGKGSGQSHHFLCHLSDTEHVQGKQITFYAYLMCRYDSFILDWLVCHHISLH
jgi:hypothetical protein